MNAPIVTSDMGKTKHKVFLEDQEWFHALCHAMLLEKVRKTCSFNTNIYL